MRQEADHVHVEARTASGATQVRRASYAVGADGAHSAVRRSLGLPFPGRSVLRSVMVAGVRPVTDRATRAISASSSC